jgi:spermidine/putrescine-binding protein
VPTEGGTLWVDNLCIPAQAPHPDLAHAFIAFTLEPEIAAMISNGNQYASPVAAADPHLDPALLANPAVYPPPAVMDTLTTIEDLGEATQLYDRAWTAIKTD